MYVCDDCMAEWDDVHIVGNHPCPSCKGTGQSKHGASFKLPCGGCRGSGIVLNKMAYVGCPQCYSRNVVEDVTDVRTI